MRRTFVSTLVALVVTALANLSHAGTLHVRIYTFENMAWLTAQGTTGLSTASFWISPDLVILEIEPDGIGGPAPVPEVPGLQALANALNSGYCGGQVSCSVAQSDAGPVVTDFGTGNFIEFFKGTQAALDQGAFAMETFLGKISLAGPVNSTVYFYPATPGQIAFSSGTDLGGGNFSSVSVSLIPLVPEPSSIVLVGLAIAGVVLRRAERLGLT